MFLALKNYNTELAAMISSLLDDYKQYNCYNPSIRLTDNHILIVFRAYSFNNKKKPFNAYYLIYDRNEKTKKLINLEEYLNTYSVFPISDPKFFDYNGEIWVTFNTGHYQRPNSIYIMRAHPSLGEPLECKIDGRSEIEKNWAFFIKDGVLHALYSLTPAKVIVEIRRNHKQRTVHFQFDNASPIKQIVSNVGKLTIGTQLCSWKEGFYLIAHKKYRIFNKRIYYGKVISLNASFELGVSEKTLFHSVQAMFGGTPKHNKNLLSCTYFSGLFIEQKSALISYGINDLDFAVKEIELDSLW